MFGRATALREKSGESWDERQMRQELEAERVFSSLSPTTQDEADQLLTEGKVIEAIKLFREETSLGLRDAKIVADHRRRHLRGSTAA